MLIKTGTSNIANDTHRSFLIIIYPFKKCAMLDISNESIYFILTKCQEQETNGSSFICSLDGTTIAQMPMPSRLFF